MLMDQIGTYYLKTEERFTRIDERFTNIDERFSRIDEQFTKIDEQFTQIDERFTEVRLHFDVTAETLTRDFQDAHREDIICIKERLARVERKVGLAS